MILLTKSFPLARLSTTMMSVVLLVLSLAGCENHGTVNNHDIEQEINRGMLAETQSIVINNTAEPESLDPHKVSAVPEGDIIRQMLIGLVNTDIDGKTIPGMAESWQSIDNKVWIFNLRDASWSNGKPVTADDFVYSWQRLVDPITASPYASYLSDAKVVGAKEIIAGEANVDSLGIQAIDDKILKVTLLEQVPYFPDMLIHTSTKPVPKEVIEKHGNKWTAPNNMVVNGPYTLSKWQINDKIELIRNPNYFDNDNTKIDKVTILPISSSSTNVALFQGGDLDISSEVPAGQFEMLKQKLGDELKVTPRLCTYYFKYNTVKAPFNDGRVRRALALALDRNIITGKVMGIGEDPAYQLTPPSTNGMSNNPPEWQSWSKERRITKAIQLLNEAGYNDKHPLKFELLYNTSENNTKIAVAFSSLIKEALGEEVVKIDMVNKEWKTYLATRRIGDFDIARSSWCADYNEPSSFLNTLKTGNSNNHGKYSNPQFDSLMEQTLKDGVDVQQRAELYRQAEAQLDKDMPNLNIYYYVGVRLVKPYVIGFPEQDPLDMWQAKDMAIAKH